MTLPDVVVCSGGLRVAQRGAAPSIERGLLRVGPVAPVAIPDGPAMEAQRGDGVVWRRHWTQPDRMVVDFVDVARVEVNDRAGRVRFDRPLPPDQEQHLLLDHVLPLVLARRGRLVLHGGVINRHRQAVVLVGSPGAGKSTLTAYAWQQGWTVGGDDGAVLHASAPPDPPEVEPTYATIRLTEAAAELLGMAADPETARAAGVAGKLRIDGGDRPYSPERVTLRAVVVVDPSERPLASFTRLGGIDAHAELFGSTFHAEFSPGRLLPAVIADLATIVESTTVGRLAVPRGLPGLAAAEQVLRSLVGEG